MFVDASALVAMLTNEDDARSLAARIQTSQSRITSPAAVWETVINCARILGISIPEMEIEVQTFLAELKIQNMPITPEAALLAIAAFQQYGKGRHPAQLNFGDCMAYACARHYGLPLLFKGGDFALTDIEAA
jgi:ribonuclease VapC